MYIDYGFDDGGFDESANLFGRQYQYRSRSRRLATGAIVGIAIACFVFLLACLLCCYFCCLRKRRSKRAGAHTQPVAHHNGAAGGGGFLGKFMPGHNNHHNQPAYGPGMQQAGYGGQQPMYGGQHNGVQQPPPTYR